MPKIKNKMTLRAMPPNVRRMLTRTLRTDRKWIKKTALARQAYVYILFAFAVLNEQIDPYFDQRQTEELVRDLPDIFATLAAGMKFKWPRPWSFGGIPSRKWRTLGWQQIREFCREKNLLPPSVTSRSLHLPEAEGIKRPTITGTRTDTGTVTGRFTSDRSSCVEVEPAKIIAEVPPGTIAQLKQGMAQIRAALPPSFVLIAGIRSIVHAKMLAAYRVGITPDKDWQTLADQIDQLADALNKTI